jgi:hypothetical protein
LKRKRLYLAGVRETLIKIVLVHPVLQIADPESTDLVGAGRLRLLLRRNRLRRRLSIRGPHLRRLGLRLRLRRHHHVGLLLLLLLLVLLSDGVWSHARSSWLHHFLFFFLFCD